MDTPPSSSFLSSSVCRLFVLLRVQHSIMSGPGFLPRHSLLEPRLFLRRKKNKKEPSDSLFIGSSVFLTWSQRSLQVDAKEERELPDGFAKSVPSFSQKRSLSPPAAAERTLGHERKRCFKKIKANNPVQELSRAAPDSVMVRIRDFFKRSHPSLTDKCKK